MSRRAIRLNRSVAALCVLSSLWVLPVSAADAVRIRGADHAGYSRLVFEWPRAVEYQAQVAGEEVIVTFKADGDLSAQAISRIRLGRVGTPSITRENGQTVLRFKAQPGVGIHHYRSGGKIVLDVKDSAQKTDATKTGAKKADAAKPASPAAKTAKPQQAAQTTVEDDFLNGQLSELKATAAADAKARAEAKKRQEEADRKSRQEFERALAAASANADGKAIQGKVEPIGKGIALRYQFPAIVPAAAFARGDTLIIAWSGDHAITHAPMEKATGDRVRTVERLSVGGSTVLRYRIRPGLGVGFRRDGTLWSLELKDQDVLPREAIQLVRQSDPVAGVRLFAPVPEPGIPVELMDPTDNRPLILVPVSSASAGYLEASTYPGGTVLRSVQGLAVKPSNASVRAVRHANGIAFIGLEATSAELATRGYFTRDDGTVGRARLIDFPKWAGNKKIPFADRKGELLHALSMAKPAEQQEQRWQLAQFYLGNGMAADALGVLERMLQIEPDLKNAPVFRAARGVARLKLHHLNDAYEDLGHPILDNEPEALLWRSLALEAMGRPQEALEAYATGADVIQLYEAEQRAQFRLAAVRADMALGGGAIAKRDLAGLEKPQYSAEIRAEAAYWRGVLAARANDRAKAAAEFTVAQSLGGRRIDAMAALALTEDELARKSITAQDAIDRLDRLRFAWRGDDFELALLERLGELYLEVKDPRSALTALRQAVNYFKPSPRTRAIADRMTDVFRNLFLEGGADEMSPAQALGLYYDFRDLTPLGAEGDTMIRRLAERLVNVDLYDRAASLLEHQVKYRLEGVPQAVVASQLAMIHLMNDAPDEAIGVLRATRQRVMPDDVRMERNRIEARALLELGRADEAEAILERDTSAESKMLMVDVYWKAKDWTRHAEALKAVMPPAGAKLDKDGRRLVMRAAVTAAMLSDEAGLAALRRSYGAAMKGDSLGAAFDIITAPGGEGASNISNLSDALKDINRIDAFIQNYKAAFRGA